MDTRSGRSLAGVRSDGAVEIAVLGPMYAAVNDRPSRLGGRRPKTIMATLLLARGAVVDDDEIIDAVWSDQRPRSVRQSLHTYVRNLRQVLEPGRRSRQDATVLIRHASGYSLNVGPGAVDAERFTTLARDGSAALAAGRPYQAVELIGTALRLWRGPAYADLAGARLVRSAVTQLEEIRSVAREDWISARMRLGDHRNLLPDARALTHDYPLHERAWGLRALALYRCGRQADALAVLQEAREILREELGVDPGPDLKALHAAILAQDAALIWSPQSATLSSNRPPHDVGKPTFLLTNWHS